MQQDRNDAWENVWEKFVNNEPVDTSMLRPEILDSWQRCRGKVSPHKGRIGEMLPAEELEHLKIKNRELIDIAVPVMKNLYDFVRGSEFSISLAVVENENLIFVEAIGDLGAIRLHEKVNAISGSNWAESIAGTTAVSLAFYHNQPFQVYPYENWCVGLRGGATSAALVHDPDTKKVIGVLAMSHIKVHPHTLGMVVAAADSIEKQIAISHLARKAEIANHSKTVIMDCFSDGIIALDQIGQITHINQKAFQILGFEQNPIGQNIFRVLDRTYGTLKRYSELGRVIDSNENVIDQFVNIQDAEGLIRCVVNTRFLQSKGQLLGKILIIQKLSRAARLVTNALGNYARFTFAEIIGQDPKFLDCIKIGIKVAKTSSNVVILGESGTGKDLFAQAIHNASSRRDQPYLAINCAAIPRDLLGSELFGYVEGAFTGAKKGGSPGKFELAEGGTIFLDEIGEMPLDMQTSLLRVLEEKAVTRVGDKSAIPVDVRIIAATNKNLAREVEKGNFRADLYYRINVITFELPPLRDRIGDIPLLMPQFIKKLSERMETKIDCISPDVYRICSQYNWPGNIRELQNVIDRAVNLAEGNVLSSDLLPGSLAESTDDCPQNPNVQKLRNVRRTTEQSTILRCLEKYRGNMTLAAKELGIARSTLYQKVRELNCN